MKKIIDHTNKRLLSMALAVIASVLLVLTGMGTYAFFTSTSTATDEYTIAGMYILEEGPSFNDHVYRTAGNNKSNVKQVVFDFWSSDYESLLGDFEDGEKVDQPHEGTIRMFYKNNVTYVLSKGMIQTNPDSSRMFDDLTAVKEIDFDNYNTKSVVNGETVAITNMNAMFRRCQALTTVDVSDFDTSEVTNMGETFSMMNGNDLPGVNSVSLQTIDVSGWDTSNVTTMYRMFAANRKLKTIDVSGWDTSNVTNMEKLFFACDAVTELDVSGWDTANVTTLFDTFNTCKAVTTLDVSGWDTSKVTSMRATFNACYALTSLGTDDNSFGELWSTSGVKTMQAMFDDCRALEKLDISSFDTANVTNMRNMFHNCYSLTDLDVSGLNFKKVQTMISMFQNCSSLEYLHLETWDTTASNGLNATANMFAGCTSLIHIYATEDLVFPHVSSSTKMFNGDNVLDGGSGTLYSTYGNKDMSFAHLDGGYIDPGYFYKERSVSILKPGPDMNELIKDYGSTYKHVVFDVWNAEYDSKFGGWDTNDEIADVNETGSIRMWFTGDNGGTVYILSNDFIQANPDCSSFFSDFADLEDITFNNFATRSTVDGEEVAIENMSKMFFDCSSLTTIDVADWDTGSVTNLWATFNGCSGLTDLDVSNWDTSNVETLRTTFYNCSSLTSIDVSGWDTSKVTTLQSTFSGCEDLETLDVSGWDTSAVTYMGNTFQNCKSLTEIGVAGWDTSNVTTMQSMFYHCESLEGELDLSGWDTSKVTSMRNMFQSCESLSAIDVSQFDTSSVRDMVNMFNGLGLTELDVSSFDTSRVLDMHGMFYGCPELTTIYASEAFTAKPAQLANGAYSMFRNSPNLVGGNGTTFIDSTSGWSGTYAWIDGLYGKAGYFHNKGEITLAAMLKTGNDIRNAIASEAGNLNNVRHVVFDDWSDTYAESFDWEDGTFVDMDEQNVKCFYDDGTIYILSQSEETVYLNSDSSWMFSRCYNLLDVRFAEGSDYSADKTDSMQDMFNYCRNLNAVDFGDLDTSHVADMGYMFSYVSYSTSLTITGLDTSGAAAMNSMFTGCSSLTSLDAASIDTSNAARLDSMFQNCSSLTSLNVKGFDTSHAVNMRQMFMGCNGLTKLDLSSFETSNVTDMYRMFYNCRNLVTIYARDSFVTSAVTNSNQMFYNCSHVVGGNGTVFDSAHIDKEYAVIDGKNDLKGYFTEKADPSYLKGYDLNSAMGDAAGDRENIGKAVFDEWSDDYAAMFTWEDGEAADNSDGDYARAFFDSDSATVYVLSKKSDLPLNADCSCMFMGMPKLSSVQFRAGYDESAVTTMSSMFDSCGSETDSLQLQLFDTSSVTDMSYMFCVNSYKSIDVSSIDTSSVTNMAGMFSESYNVRSLDLSGFDTGNVTSMNCLFDCCCDLDQLDLSGFDTSNVTDMGGMFGGCSSLVKLDLTGFDTSNVTDMGGMFGGCSSLVTIRADESFSVEAVEDSEYMFSNCRSIVGGAGTVYDEYNITKSYAHIDSEDDPGYFTGEGTTENKLLVAGPAFNSRMAAEAGDASAITSVVFDEWDEGSGFDWDSEGTYVDVDSTYAKAFFRESTGTMFILSKEEIPMSANGEGMFKGLPSLTSVKVYDGFDTTTLTSAQEMFSFSGTGRLTIEGLDTSRVTNMNGMFQNSGCTEIDVSHINTSSARDMSSMFYNCKNLTGLDLRGFTTGSVSSMQSMFRGCKNLESLDVSRFNTKGVTYMQSMFYGCESLTELDLSSFNTKSAQNMQSMFYGCSSLTDLDISGFITKHVMNMNYMFYGCSSLAEVDISSFETTSSLQSTRYMFMNCTALTTIYASESFVAAGIGDSYRMFYECTLLKGGSGTAYSPQHVNASYAHIDGGADNPGYFTSKTGGRNIVEAADPDADPDADAQAQDVTAEDGTDAGVDTEEPAAPADDAGDRASDADADAAAEPQAETGAAD